MCGRSSFSTKRAASGAVTLRKRQLPLPERPVIPWIELDRVALPGGGDLRLMRRGHEFSIKLGVRRTHDLATVRIRGGAGDARREKLGDRARPRILIGGLGMGFTLRAALGASARGARSSSPNWSRRSSIGRGARWRNCSATVSTTPGRIGPERRRQADRASAASYDAILLDVDNGPEGMTQAANDALYSLRGLSAARASLRRAGCSPSGRRGPTGRSRKGSKRRVSRSRTNGCAPQAYTAGRGT